MKLAIYNHGIQFDGSTPFQGPLGGSESSIVYMSRELARAGHDVTVYVNLPSPTSRGQRGPGTPDYRHYYEFFTDYPSNPWDVLIAFRSFDPLLIGRVAPRMIYWTGDAFDQPALKNFNHPSLQANLDRVFCVSEWHRRTFIETFALPPEKVIATRNGFNPEFVAAKAERDWLRAAYTSTPFRGLEVLLAMFPEIRRRIPALTLDVFSSMKVYGWDSDKDHKAFSKVYKSANQPGVNLHGSRAQPALLERLSTCGFLLYPNVFDETSCISAIEAQASGCVVMTSAKAGLNETVQHGKTGICIAGDPRSSEYQREYINTLCSLFENPERLQQFSDAARARAFREYTWASVAAEWTGILQAIPANEVNARWSGPLTLLQKTHGYLESGNVSAAKRVLARLDETPFLRNEVEALKGKLSTWM